MNHANRNIQEHKENEHKYRDKIQKNSSMNVNLFPHQLESVYQLEKLEKNKKREFGDLIIETTMGVFGDLPGFGKTLSIITLLDRDKMEWNLEEEFYCEEIVQFGPSSTYISKMKIQKQKLNSSLVVCSNSIISQWEKELDRSDDLNYITITKKSDMDYIDPEDMYDVVLVSDKMYNELIKRFSEYAWKRFIFDEASSTRITSMKTPYAGFYWFITATFPNLSKIKGRNTHFIKNIFSSMNPLTFDLMLVKNNDEFVKESYSIPNQKTIYHECINPGVLNVLGDMVNRDVLHMIEAGDIEGAIRDLGGEEGKRNLIDVVSSKFKDELEEAKLKVKSNFKTKGKDSAHKERYEMWIGRVEELEKKLKTINDRYANVLNEDCSICYSGLNKPVLLPCCQNIVCGDCMVNWLKVNNSCHMCRSKIALKDLISVSIENEIDDDIENEEEEGKNKKEKKSKPDTIVDIILDKPDGKFIVFSSYDESFSIIKKVFADNEINFVELKGRRETRDKKLNSYMEGDVNVIFLNSKFNGAGINLQVTSDIIIYHEMDDLLQTQLIGRANRIGRKSSLTIHKLV